LESQLRLIVLSIGLNEPSTFKFKKPLPGNLEMRVKGTEIQGNLFKGDLRVVWWNSPFLYIFLDPQMV